MEIQHYVQVGTLGLREFMRRFTSGLRSWSGFWTARRMAGGALLWRTGLNGMNEGRKHDEI